MVLVHGVICKTRTFPTKCSFCGAGVYYFSCECQSKVFFDELGGDWPIHDCIERRSKYGGGATSGYPGPSSWKPMRDVSIIRGAKARADLLPGLRAGTQSIDPAIVRRVVESGSRQRDTMRLDPMGSKTEEIIGVVQEIIAPDLERRFKMPRHTVGFEQLAKQIGDGDPVQITLRVDELADDPAAIDFLSYTFLCPRRLVNAGVRRDAVLHVLLAPVEILGAGRVWLAKTLEAPF